MPEGIYEQNTAAMNRLAAALEAQQIGRPPAAATAAVDGKRLPGRPKKVISLEDVKAIAMELMDKKGKPAAVALIKKHGADSLAELEDSQYSKFIAAGKVLLSEEDEPEDEDDDSL